MKILTNLSEEGEEIGNKTEFINTEKDKQTIKRKFKSISQEEMEVDKDLTGIMEIEKKEGEATETKSKVLEAGKIGKIGVGATEETGEKDKEVKEVIERQEEQESTRETGTTLTGNPIKRRNNKIGLKERKKRRQKVQMNKGSPTFSPKNKSPKEKKSKK